MKVTPVMRLPLLALGALALLWGMWLGLNRMGITPVLSPRALSDHGPLMVGGFLGTVIALERAVASGRLWSYAGPLFCAVGVALFLVGQPAMGAFALLVGSAVVALVLALVVRGDAAVHHVVLAGASLAWLVGNALLASGRPVFEVVPFWVLFLVGTIAAERLEMTRVLPRSKRVVQLFLAIAATSVIGVLLTLVARDQGMRLFGAAELALCLWLSRYDIARRTVKQSGATRYIAVALLCGYLWLGVSGLLALLYGNPIAGPRYDALLHAVLVGFVFSMIFGHALVILPAVAGVKVPFKPRFYVHLGLLHASVALRLIGDLAMNPELRKAGGWANAAAILLFLASTLIATLGAKRSARSAPTGAAAPARS